MDGLYRSIELPDPTNYGLTSELKPEQKAEASIMARASTASEGHNWWLKLFARALILMEVHNWWGKAIPLTNKTIPYWHNFYLYEIWRLNQTQSISARAQTGSIQIHPYPADRLNPDLPVPSIVS